MLGISTVWKSQELKDGRELLKGLSRLGINNFELEYRISETTFAGIKKVLEKDNILRITSIHNYFPIPHESDVGGGDIFMLSSACKEERLLAVQYTIRTIQIAAELGAHAVVVHLGKVPMETVKNELFKLYDDDKIGSAEHQVALGKFAKKREENKGKTFDMLLLSVEALIKAAETVGVKIGIENRYYFSEYPNFDEFGILLRNLGMIR
ncbi:MAG: sugar phosphate isomerase/epimerase [Candidatus Scalindua sp.]|nr:sugar phosphate isomerase/epimerase [Candidatus Scalindua sp.]